METYFCCQSRYLVDLLFSRCKIVHPSKNMEYSLIQNYQSLAKQDRCYVGDYDDDIDEDDGLK